MSVAVMGVDPGTKGSVAVVGGITDVGAVVFHAPFKPGMTSYELSRLIKRAAGALLQAGTGGRVAYLEQVTAQPRDGVMGAFTFGRAAGLVEGMLLSEDVEVRYVAPIMWQGAMECLTGGNKAISAARARGMWPLHRLTQETAESLLIAEHGRRRLLGLRPPV